MKTKRSSDAISAVEMVHGFRDGTHDPVAVTEVALASAHAAQSGLNAFTFIDADHALSASAASAARWRDGRPLSAIDGVPVSIKDNIACAGWPTTHGSLLIDPNNADPADAPAVGKLRRAGAVLIGKTTTSEFCFKAVGSSPRHGDISNPIDHNRTAGGSSAGAAASVAAGVTPIALATDGGGSIRIPASFCGLVGFKPTFGRIASKGQGPMSFYSHIGTISRCVDDAALLYDAAKGSSAGSWFTLPGPDNDIVAEPVRLDQLRVAFMPGFNAMQPDPAVLAVADGLIRQLRDAGAHVALVDDAFPYPYEDFERVWAAILAYATASIDGPARALLDPALRSMADAGMSAAAAVVLEGDRRRIAAGEWVETLLTDYDFLLMPTVPTTAFAVGRDWPEPDDRWRFGRWMGYTYPFNLTQNPAITLPVGNAPDGMPIGLQLVAARFADSALLAAARAIEALYTTEQSA